MASSSIAIDMRLRSFLAQAQREARTFDPGNDDDEAPGISVVRDVARIAFAGVLDRRTWSRICADLRDLYRPYFGPVGAVLDLRQVRAMRLTAEDMAATFRSFDRRPLALLVRRQDKAMVDQFIWSARFHTGVGFFFDGLAFTDVGDVDALLWVRKQAEILGLIK